jgi:hypothetical protein
MRASSTGALTAALLCGVQIHKGDSIMEYCLWSTVAITVYGTTIL